MQSKIFNTTATNKFVFDKQPGNIFIRLMVGLVFLSEGIQKFLFPTADGVGRFIKIGIVFPHFFAPVVGAAEIICSTLLIIGLLTRLAAVPLLIIILTAIYTTKIPILTNKGFWSAAHEGRADFCMLMGLIFLLLYGAGKYSADSKLLNNKN